MQAAVTSTRPVEDSPLDVIEPEPHGEQVLRNALVQPLGDGSALLFAHRRETLAKARIRSYDRCQLEMSVAST